MKEKKTYDHRRCTDCLFWRRVWAGANYGDCHRFPARQTVPEDYWCGELRSEKEEVRSDG